MNSISLKQDDGIRIILLAFYDSKTPLYLENWNYKITKTTFMYTRTYTSWVQLIVN